jgi:hypothetical protein
VAKYGLAVAFHVLVESNAWPSLGQDHLKRDIAGLQRITPEIVGVQFDQIEGVQENAFVMAAASDRLRGGLSGGVSGPSFFGTSFFCAVALVLVAMSLSRAGAAREVRKRHHGTRAKRSVILSVIVPADGTSAATCMKRRLRYVADFWAALGQTTALPVANDVGCRT